MSAQTRRPKTKTGRPSKYDPAVHDRLVHEMALLGATEQELARAIGISTPTLWTWKNQHPSFLNALKEGKAVADAQVEKSLFQRATGYAHPDVHITNFQGAITQTKVVKRYPPDTTAMIFWLKNRKPTEWRDKMEVDGRHTIEAGDTLTKFIQKLRERRS